MSLKKNPTNFFKSINNKYFMMFANCIPIKGKDKSTIYDIQRMNYYNIPNDLYHFLKYSKNKSIKNILPYYGSNNMEIIYEYLLFLLENELIFFVDNKKELKSYPAINKKWITNKHIDNLILDLDFKTFDLQNLNLIIEKITFLFCENIKIRAFNYNENIRLLKTILIQFEGSIINNIIIELEISQISHLKELKTLKKTFNRLEKINIYHNHLHLKTNNCFFNLFNYKLKKREPELIFLYINNRYFYESQMYNPYFNQKMHIDSNGNIKNSINTNDIFGNIYNTDPCNLKKIIKSKEYNKYALINKNIIEKCKNCSYRYMCVDNRIPNINNKNIKYNSICGIQ